jgi:hypothetical protein
MHHFVLHKYNETVAICADCGMSKRYADFAKKPCAKLKQPQGSPSNSSDLLGRMRGLEADHGPEGWPAVKMKDISALCDELEKARRTAQYWKDEHLAGNAENEALRQENARLRAKVKKLAAQRNTAYGYGSDAGKPPWME